MFGYWFWKALKKFRKKPRLVAGVVFAGLQFGGIL